MNIFNIILFGIKCCRLWGAFYHILPLIGLQDQTGKIYLSMQMPFSLQNLNFPAIEDRNYFIPDFLQS